MTKSKRYRVDVIDGPILSYRITDTRTDTRVGTCYSANNASFICYALNQLPENHRIMDDERLAMLKQSPRSADVTDVEDLCEALESARIELNRWDQVWENVKRDNPNLREDNKPLAVAATYALMKSK